MRFDLYLIVLLGALKDRFPNIRIEYAWKSCNDIELHLLTLTHIYPLLQSSDILTSSAINFRVRIDEGNGEVLMQSEKVLETRSRKESLFEKITHALIPTRTAFNNRRILILGGYENEEQRAIVSINRRDMMRATLLWQDIEKRPEWHFSPEQKFFYTSILSVPYTFQPQGESYKLPETQSRLHVGICSRFSCISGHVSSEALEQTAHVLFHLALEQNMVHCTITTPLERSKFPEQVPLYL